MNRTWTVTCALAGIAAIAACKGKPVPPKQTAVATPGQRQAKTAEAAGEVVKDSASPRDNIKWLNDANIVALLTTMNQRQIAAADAELSTWHVDTVRAFAVAMTHEHSEMQHSIDSLIEAIHVAPVTPALGVAIRGQMQAQIDSIYQHGGRALDRAYITQVVGGHQLMARYLNQLSALAEAPAVSTLIGSLTTRVQSQIARGNAMRALFAIADSIAADSVRRAAERRSRAGKKG